MCYILELYDKNPWTNNKSKLATFDPILQRPHSALGDWGERVQFPLSVDNNVVYIFTSSLKVLGIPTSS